MKQSPYLSVVIPSYNEVRNLNRGVLEEVIGYLKNQHYSYEVILTDDGSKDGTADALDAFARKHDTVRVLHNVHKGKAPTVTAGMLEATGEWCLFTDFDQSTPLHELEKLLPWIGTHSVIIGSREITGAHRDREPWYRHVMGKVFNFIVQLFTVRGVHDTQCGFKLFAHDVVQPLFSNLVVYQAEAKRSDPFTGAFDVELLYLSQKYGYPIKEVPIKWKHNPTERVSPFKDSLRMFRDVVRIRLADMQGKYASTPT